MKKFVVTAVGFLLLWMASANLTCAAGAPVKGETPVIVIDPGHGGENLGTEANISFPGGIPEKEMDLITAKAMYEELRAFDGVTVYLTRDSDQDLTLKARAEFAAGVDADYLFSIHYNASEDHDQFGAEVWVPLRAPFNGYGYQFGTILLRDLEEMGILNCGVKTRRNDKGKDYYGIIREAYEREIPSFIIEHCHVDERRDTSYCDSVEDMEFLGRKDAHSVAKFLGLKSEKLGVDYSSHSLVEVDYENTVPVTIQDGTPPSLCLLEILKSDEKACTISAHLLAQDQESPLLYYAYSLDGGLTFSERYAWPGTDCLLGTAGEVLDVELSIPSGIRPNVVFRAINMYGLYTDSNHYLSDVVFQASVPPEPDEEPGNAVETMKEIKYDFPQTEEESLLSPKHMMGIAILSAVLIALLYGMACVITVMRSRHRQGRQR
ncbi:MAG: N-acetylmuramoyl-L-alanine amidase [Acetatifactor sp.]